MLLVNETKVYEHSMPSRRWIRGFTLQRVAREGGKREVIVG